MTDNPYETSKTAENPPQLPANPRGTLLRVVVLLGILLLVLACILPFPFSRGPAVRKSAGRIACTNNLRNICLAIQQYASAYESLPPAYTIDAAGKPLHSWRTLILPYLEQKALYAQIDLTKPWDDPANKLAHDTVVKVYACPSSHLDPGQTTYLAAAISGSCFEPGKLSNFEAITDGRTNTLLVLDIDDEHAVHWMSPRDIDEPLLSKLAVPLTSAHPNGVLAVFADGHTESLKTDLTPETLRALISIAGNDNAQADF